MLCVRPRLGQSESWGSDLHRVLRYPQEPWHPPVQSSLPGPGRMAAGAHQSHDSHRQRARQQRVGGQHTRTAQTHAGCQQVGSAVSSAARRRQGAVFHLLPLWMCFILTGQPSNLCSCLCWTTGDSNKWVNFSVTLVLISVYLRVNDACVCL